MDQSLTPACFSAALPAAPLVSAEWDIFSLRSVEPPPHFTGKFADHVLTLQEAGNFRARQSLGGRPAEGMCQSGCVGLVPATRTVTWERLDGCAGARAISLFVPAAALSRVVSQDWDKDPQNVELEWRFLGRDPIAANLLTSLADEARDESPRGRLYAESACEFLAHHLIRRYSSLCGDPPRVRGGLTPRRLKIVTEYINENLARPITLRILCGLAGVSPRHFERAFRQSVGVAPHSYVLETRVAVARRLLISDPALTIEEIAARVGFCSSSHLGSAFRRRTGLSPSAFRAMQLG